MDHFEYISVAVSIVLSLGVVRLLDSIRYAFDPTSRYLVHALWIIVKLMNHVLFWWALWSYRDFAGWNILMFSWVLLFPGLLYMQVTSLVTTTPDDIADWREHFYSIRRWFLSANILLILHTTITASLVLSPRSFYAMLIAQSFLLVVNIIGIVSANPRAQLTIVLVALTTQVFGFGSVFFVFGDDGAA
jgi:hypothetical protein